MAFYSGLHLFASYSSAGFTNEDSFTPLPATAAVISRVPLGYYFYSYPVIVAAGTVMVPAAISLDYRPYQPLVKVDNDVSFSVGVVDNLQAPGVASSTKLSSSIGSVEVLYPSGIVVEYALVPSVGQTFTAGSPGVVVDVNATPINLLQAATVNPRLKYAVNSNIVGIQQEQVVQPPIITVAVASTMVPIGVSISANVADTCKITTSSKLTPSLAAAQIVTDPLLKRSIKLTNVPVQQHSVSITPQVKVGVACIATSVVTNQIVNDPSITLAVWLQVTPITTYSQVETPSIQEFLRFFSRMMLQGSTVVSLDLWRY